MKKLIALLTLLSLSSCKEKQQNPEDILYQLSNLYMNQEAIDYKVSFKQKFFDSPDTTAINAECSLLREPNDSIFGGYISYKTSDGVKKVYDTTNIYVADSTENNATIYKAHEGQDFAISGNFSVAVINEYFFKPSLLRDLVKDKSVKKSLSEESKYGVNCYKIVLRFPDQDGFTNSTQSIWLAKKDKEVIAMKDVVQFQGNLQVKEWHYTKSEFKNTKTSFFKSEIQKITAVYKSEYYKEPDESYYQLLPDGSPAPDFRGINTLTGEELTLGSLKGKVILLDFFYMSCMPCIKAIPELSKLQKKFDGKLLVIGLNSKDNFDNKKSDISEFIKKNKINYRTMWVNSEVDKVYNVNVYPSLYLIDKEGKISFSQLGYNENLYFAIDKILMESL